jgi:pimeloyl-ACP methyl ester carboxylesterase
MDERRCRICLDAAESEETGALFSPCRCAGSIGLVHTRCQEAWRDATARPRDEVQCAVCGHRYGGAPYWMTTLTHPVWREVWVALVVLLFAAVGNVLLCEEVQARHQPFAEALSSIDMPRIAYRALLYGNALWPDVCVVAMFWYIVHFMATSRLEGVEFLEGRQGPIFLLAIAKSAFWPSTATFPFGLFSVACGLVNSVNVPVMLRSSTHDLLRWVARHFRHEIAPYRPEAA